MTALRGHEEAVATFRAGLSGGRLHHAWLLAGPAGVGKALFARKAALHVLAGRPGPSVPGPGLEIPDDHPAARLVAAGSHPDLVRLERTVREGAAELSRSITVDQVRSIQRLFATTSSLSPWRVVIIDAIDDLERAAANALLKNLEEPPPRSLFLLVSHAPERLLPTIRSRCRLVRFSPLEDDVMASALRDALPDAEAEEIAALVTSGGGSPGRALSFRGLDIAGLDRAIGHLTESGDPFNVRRSQLAHSLSVKSAQARYEAFLSRVPSAIAAAARSRSGAALGEALDLWERASSLAGSASRLSLDPHATVFALAGMLAALAPDRPSSPRSA